MFVRECARNALSFLDSRHSFMHIYRFEDKQAGEHSEMFLSTHKLDNGLQVDEHNTFTAFKRRYYEFHVDERKRVHALNAILTAE